MTFVRNAERPSVCATGLKLGGVFVPAALSQHMERLILDLCSGSGNWSLPYAEAGYEVLRIDLPRDVRLIEHLNRPVHGILAAPPCTVFSLAGAWVTRTEDETKLALSVVDACLRAVAIYRPAWWALENPTGKLRRYLGKPTHTFHPCDYGDAYTKKTDLWGSFTLPQKSPVNPVGSLIDVPGMKSCTSKKERAKTPMGFARAFFAANL